MMSRIARKVGDFGFGFEWFQTNNAYSTGIIVISCIVALGQLADYFLSMSIQVPQQAVHFFAPRLSR